MLTSLSTRLHTEMDFKKATDALFDGVTHEELAGKLRSSVPSIRQARLAKESKAYRRPPEYWEAAVKALAESRVKHYQRLIWQMEKEIQAKGRRTLAAGEGNLPAQAVSYLRGR